jgi:hypothetical protein
MIPRIIRYLMGFVCAVLGLNGFLNFLPMPKTALPPFFLALLATGYMLKLISVTLLVSGILLLANRLVPFALLLMAPLMVNVLLYHIFLDPGGIGLALVVTAMEIYLAWVNRAAYATVFQPQMR